MRPIDRRTFILAGVGGVLAAPNLAGGGERAEALPKAASFRLDDLHLKDVSEKQLIYYSSTVTPLRSSTPVDSDGIVVRLIDGKSYNHPVLQAQHMLHMLASYSINHDSDYLAEVEAHADRVRSYAVTSNDAAFLPYPFAFNLHSDPSLNLSVPWYSGMAQGQALGAFSRLARVTDSREHREFASSLFASFDRLNDIHTPWTPVVDANNALWFEEYPRSLGGACHALNGHIFALCGLYDYWQLTKSSAAYDYIVGGMSAVLAHIDEFRNPTWVSHYCLTHQFISNSYHRVHVGQLYQLFTYTGSTRFAQYADKFLTDYPAAQSGGRCYVAAGPHVLLSGGSSGEAPAISVTTDRPSIYVCDSRAGLAGQRGVYLRLKSGPYAGQWVQELPLRSYLIGAVESYKYTYPRLLRFAKGTYTGHKFGTDGTSAQQKTRTLKAASGAHTGQRLVQNGLLHHKIIDGIWAGWWISDDNRVVLT